MARRILAKKQSMRVRMRASSAGAAEKGLPWPCAHHCHQRLDAFQRRVLVEGLDLFVQIAPAHLQGLGGFSNIVLILDQFYFDKFFFKCFAGLLEIVYFHKRRGSRMGWMG